MKVIKKIGSGSYSKVKVTSPLSTLRFFLARQIEFTRKLKTPDNVLTNPPKRDISFAAGVLREP